DQAFPLLRRLGQELLSGSLDGYLVRLDFNLGHGFHAYRHALLGVEILLRRYVKAHQLQRQQPAALDHGKNESATLNHLRPPDAISDQRLIGPDLAIETGKHGEHKHHRENDQPRNDENSLQFYRVPQDFHKIVLFSSSGKIPAFSANSFQRRTYATPRS